MVMNYSKKMVRRFMSLGLLLLVGCAQQSVNLKSSETTAKQLVKPEVVLLDTSHYLPKQQYDKLGNKLDYQRTANPYLIENQLTEKRVVETSSVTRFIKARRAYKAGDWQQAKQTLHELTKADTSLAGPWVILGHIAKQQNDLPLAEKHYSKAQSINHNNVNTYIALATVQRQLGKFTHAQNTYVKALSVWQDFPEAHLNLAILYDIYLNQPKNAQMHMEAYQFLSHSKNKQASKWLAEIKQRTGVQTSYIDTGIPKNPASQISSL